MLARMGVRREVRASDSPLVERITRVRFDTAWRGVTTPDGCWDIVVRRVQGRVELLQTGSSPARWSWPTRPGTST